MDLWFSYTETHIHFARRKAGYWTSSVIGWRWGLLGYHKFILFFSLWSPSFLIPFFDDEEDKKNRSFISMTQLACVCKAGISLEMRDGRKIISPVAPSSLLPITLSSILCYIILLFHILSHFFPLSISQPASTKQTHNLILIVCLDLQVCY